MAVGHYLLYCDPCNYGDLYKIAGPLQKMILVEKISDCYFF